MLAAVVRVLRLEYAYVDFKEEINLTAENRDNNRGNRVENIKGTKHLALEEIKEQGLITPLFRNVYPQFLNQLLISKDILFRILDIKPF